MPKRRVDFYLLGLPYWNPTYDEFKTWWDSVVESEERNGTILLLTNPETMNQGSKHPHVREAWEQMECFQSEGVGIRLAGWMRGHKAHYNFAGTDLIPRVCKEARGPVRVFFYGATEESNLKAVEKIQTLCPLVEIAGRVNGFVDFEKEALPAIQKSNADVVLFALGTPKQELLMLKFKEQFNAKVTVTCGGLFDFLADLKPRAPQWMRLIGMEWFFRLSLEPKRLFKRYVYGNPAFMLRSIAALLSDLKKMRDLR